MNTSTLQYLARWPNRTREKPCPGALLLALVWLTVAPSLAAQALGSPDDDPVTVYLEAIQQAQSLDGPYAEELVDLYFGYANALLEEGDLEAARDAFHRTVMVTRVNLGPNSVEQSDYLYSVADIESRLGNFEESVSVLEHIYRIHAMNYGEEAPEMLPMVEELYAWYTERQPLRGPFAGASDLQNRSYLTGRIAALSEATFGLGDERTALRYRDEGQVHFRAILHMIQTAEPPNPELIINAGLNTGSLAYQRAMGNHFKAGEAAYERAVESWRKNPEATVIEVAEAISQLGDWYLALKHFRAAEKQYERAYDLLARTAEPNSVADDYLGEPAPLRFLNPSEKFLRDLDAPVPSQGLEVAMTVTRNGRLLEIEFLNVPEGEYVEELEGFRSRLENTRFRPAVVDGKVQKMDRFVWKPILQRPNIAARDG